MTQDSEKLSFEEELLDAYIDELRGTGLYSNAELAAAWSEAYLHHVTTAHRKNLPLARVAKLPDWFPNRPAKT